MTGDRLEGVKKRWRIEQLGPGEPVHEARGVQRRLSAYIKKGTKESPKQRSEHGTTRRMED
jgi:hypothetical protein